MQADFQPAAPAMEEALPDVLMRIVSELHDVAYLIERIEPQIDTVATADAAERIMVLQGIDLAVQKVRGLAEFIDTVTASIPESWMIDVTTALNLIKLSDMRKALAAGLRHGHSQPLGKAVGDFEAF